MTNRGPRRSRRHLSPEHRAALRAGWERWRNSELPAGIPNIHVSEELPATVDARVARLRAGRAAASERRARIREQRLENLRLARAARNAPPDPVPETAETRPMDRSRGLREYRERRRAVNARRRENLARARSAPRRDRYAFSFEETAKIEMRAAIERLFETVRAALNGNFGNIDDVDLSHLDPMTDQVPMFSIYNSRAQDMLQYVLDDPNGFSRVVLTRNLMYRMLGEALREIDGWLQEYNAEHNTHYVLFATRGERWNRVTSAFIRGALNPSAAINSYSHEMDWSLNGSRIDGRRQAWEALPFPADIYFHIRNVPPPERPRRRQRRGSWAPWKNTFTSLDLSRYQIDTAGESTLSDEEAREHCFIYALRQSGEVDDTTLFHVSSELYGRALTLCSLRELCSRFDLSVRVTAYSAASNKWLYFGPRRDNSIKLGLFEDHFFLDDDLNVSEWVLTHVSEASVHGEVNNLGWAYREENGQYVRDRYPLVKTGSVLKRMRELGLLEPIRGDDPSVITKAYYSPQLLDENDLRYCPQFCPTIKLKKPPKVQPFMWFGDFETTTDGSRHLPYMLCAVSEDGAQFTTRHYQTTFANVDTVWAERLRSFLWFVVSRTPTDREPLIYFHNLNYDMAFIIPFVPLRDKFNIVEVNSRVLGFRFFDPVTGRHIAFRDSYALISAPLRSFGKMFGLDVEKEIFPYEYYTTTSFLRDAPGEDDVPMPDVDEYLTFYSEPEELLRKLSDLHLIQEGRVFADAYSQYYCLRDCEVLQKGVMCFRSQLMEVTGLDCAHYLTLPSIAYNYLIKEGVFAGCFNLAGPPLFFVRRCVLGGRCMLQRNQKQDIRGDIADFDAVSLYPSAMNRLYTLKGLPKLIEGPKRLLSFLVCTDGFFAQVAIRRVGRRLDFPLLAQARDGVMVYCNEPGIYYMDDISLWNAIKAHQIDRGDVEVLRGYYYDEGKNERIREVITHLFNQRLRLKREGNPLEQAYKLLMNSCYGKSIMKPITEDCVVADEDTFNHLIHTGGCETLSYKRVGSRYVMTLSKNIVSAKGFPTFGVHVLAMSKVIMSEVMVLAQEAGIDVYYTDTDSIHLRSSDIDRLACLFSEQYGRDLIGKQLGQFHTDFPNHPVTGNPTTSRRFIGVGKKAYIDELIDPQTGEITHHMRLKGIPNNVIQHTADRQFGGDPVALYEELLAGRPVTFDLLCGRVSFALNNDYTYVTRKEFTRTVRFRE